MAPGDGSATGRDYTIHREVSVDAPLETVWTCISEPELVSQWWCPPPTVTIAFDRESGGRYEERYDDGDFSYELSGTVETFDPRHRIVIRRETENAFGATDRITITLVEDGPAVTVALEHVFPDIPGEQRDAARAYFAEPWEHSLRLLGEVAHTVSTE